MYWLIIVACFLFFGGFQKKANTYYYWGLLLLFIVTAFRHPALGGTDNMVYYQLFQDIPTLRDVFNYESEYRIGYLLFVSTLKTLSDSYIFFQCFYTVVCFIMLNKIIQMLELNGKEKCLYLFAIWCSFSFIWDFWVLYRQNLANLIFALLLLYYIRKRDKLNGIKRATILTLAIVIPNLFHSSAIFNVIILFFYFLLPKGDKPNKRLIWTILGSIVMFFVGIIFWSYLESMVVSVDDRYMGYFETGGISLNIINYLLKIAFFWLYCINYNHLNYKYKREMLDIHTLYLLIGSINVGIVGRVASYYSFGGYVARSFVGSYKKPMNILVPIFFIAMMIIFIRSLFVMSAGLNTHFMFFWQDVNNLPSDYVNFWRGAQL